MTTKANLLTHIALIIRLEDSIDEVTTLYKPKLKKIYARHFKYLDVLVSLSIMKITMRQQFKLHFLSSSIFHQTHCTAQQACSLS
mmetsp:Transcript_10216/g.16543  ORF Transcript_10216/g.16543 Transcript_10216/m.16543 type:complete len:85 (+) Transcript_10216:2108-2362(+)